MEIITKTFYRASDGKEFTEEKECREYEQRKKEIISLTRAAKRIQEICIQYTNEADENCADCPFSINHCPFYMKRFPRYWRFKE